MNARFSDNFFYQLTEKHAKQILFSLNLNGETVSNAIFMSYAFNATKGSKTVESVENSIQPTKLENFIQPAYLFSCSIMKLSK